MPVALVDHVVEHVGGVSPVGEIAHLVDDQDVGVRVGGQRLGQLCGAEGRREIVDEGRRGGEEGVEAVLDRAVGDGDRQVGLPASRLAREDERSPVGDEVRRERRAQDGRAQRTLIREVKVVDRLEKRKMRAAREPREAGLLAMRDLLGDENRQEVAVGPGLAFRALHQIAPDPPGVGQMEALEEDVEIVGGRHQDRPPTRRDATPVLGRVQARRSAPPLRAPSAAWTRPARGRPGAASVGGRSTGSNGSGGIVASR